MSTSIERIEVLSKWVGFADPPTQAAKLTITRSGDRFLRAQGLGGPSEVVPTEQVDHLVAALSRPVVPQLDPALLGLPDAVVRAHFGSCWTDDSPAHLVRVTFATGRVVTIRAEDQHAFMLPLRVLDPEAGTEWETFDPRLSQAIAALLPDGYLEKDRLAGRLELLEGEIEDLSPQEEQPSEPPALEGPQASLSEAAQDPSVEDDLMGEILRILRGEESPEEKAEAQRTGRHSERLLRRIALEDARELLAGGANPSIADDAGQTALMHAAWPPLDRERFRLLVRAGADLEARRQDGMTGLHLACAGGEAEAVAEWVRAGADLSARTPEGATPVMLGACWLDVVRVLAGAGADVDAADQDGHTALVYAILGQSHIQAESQLAALGALIEAGADVNRRDRAGLTPLAHARAVLARAELEEEVMRAFQPDVDLSLGLDWDERRLAGAVVDLIASAGGRE
jgi:ankyrin repeat protein